MPSSELQAGAAMVDITPDAGTHLGGSGAGEHRPAQSVIDPLHARALVFESGGQRVAILALDVIIITEDYTRKIRRAASKELGILPDSLLIHATQSHSAPGLGSFMFDPDFPLRLPPELEYLRGSETPYGEYVVKQAIEAVSQAADLLQPVQVGAASGVRDRLAFNRRGVMKDGRVCMPWPAGHRQQPLGPTHIRYLEGPTDPEVGVFCARADDMSMVAMILHHSCHPVNYFAGKSSYYAVSADWPGVWASGMQGAYGENCIPLVLNGCCGNLNPWDPFDPGYVPDARYMGDSLTDMACRIVPSITFSKTGVLAARSRTIPLAYRDVPPARQKEVDQILQESPEPRWLDGSPRQVDPKWFLAASTKSIEYCRKRMSEFLYEIQVLRVGNIAFVGLPGEPFVEGQLAIKIGSPADLTYVAHMTSQYVGYIPTRDACARGGHEANAECTYWAKLAPGSLETIVDATLGLLREVFPKA